MRVSVLFATLVLAVPACAQTYKLTSLVGVGGDYPTIGQAIATSVNASGQTTGYTVYSHPDYGNFQNPYRWDASGETHLPSAYAGYTGQWAFGQANAINASGYVVGRTHRIDALYGTGSATIWSPNNEARFLSTASSTANDINDAGQVVGTVSTSAVVWDAAGVARSLVGLTDARAINNLGQVVGASGDRDRLWDPTTGVTDLGLLPGGSRSWAYDLNDAGDAVGYAQVGNNFHAFRWTGASGMIPLGRLPGGVLPEDWTMAYGINAHGKVVGQSNGNGFLWDEDNGIIDLSTLLDAETKALGWDVTLARSINDSGQIAGTAYRNGVAYAVLLTPTQAVPEPASLAALGLGVLAILRRRRQA